ncbi:MAG: hypothetical protein MMC23_003223 [Stictis urceolatum]|nr:hypothetical protein [Stictis urceolata]
MAISLAPQLTTLLASKPLHPTAPWLSAFLSTQRPTTPLPALLSTATFRLLASDITSTLCAPPHASLPADIQDPSVKTRKLPFQPPPNNASSNGSGGGSGSSQGSGGILVQVLDVEDIGRSRWSQVEAIESLERGEGTRGREIIRVEVPEVTGSGSTPGQAPSQTTGGAGTVGAGAANVSSGPHKVLLQDVKGNVVVGFESKPVEGLGVGMGIGAKMVLKGCAVARGVVMLEPETVGWLGGKIEGAHAEWVRTRKERLKAKVAEVGGEE